MNETITFSKEVKRKIISRAYIDDITETFGTWQVTYNRVLHTDHRWYTDKRITTRQVINTSDMIPWPRVARSVFDEDQGSLHRLAESLFSGWLLQKYEDRYSNHSRVRSHFKGVIT